MCQVSISLIPQLKTWIKYFIKKPDLIKLRGKRKRKTCELTLVINRNRVKDENCLSTVSTALLKLEVSTILSLCLAK